MAKKLSFADEVEACTKANKNKRISLKDNKSKSSCSVCNDARKKLGVISVDHCIKSLADKEKCDYCVLEAEVSAHYVELKGGDMKKAVSQLSSSLGHFRKLHAELSKACYAIVTRVPKSGTNTQKVKANFRKKHRVALYIERSGHTIAV
jgi:hypothetical protein